MKTKKLTAILLLAAIILSVPFLPSCEKESGDLQTGTEALTPEATTAEEEVKDPFYIKSGNSTCTVIRPVDADDKVVEIAIDLRKALEKAFPEAKMEIGNDFVKPGTPHNKDKYEILVGETDYDETKEILDELGYLDYGIAIRGRKIVITSPSEDRLKKAVDIFLGMISSSKITEENGDVRLDFEDNIVRSVYKAKNMKINGNDLKQYKIIYDKKSGLYGEAAENVRTLLATAAGVMLELAPDTTPQGEYEIVVGPTSRSAVNLGVQDFEVKVDGNRLFFEACGPNGALGAARRLYSDVLYNGGEINLSDGFQLSGTWPQDAEGRERADGTDLRIISFNILTEKWGGTDTSPRAELLGVMLENYRPDAVGIQEVCEIWMRMIPYYCGDYKLICTKRPDGVDNYSSILYDSSKYEVVDQGVVPYSMTDNKFCRNMGWAVFREIGSDKPAFGLVSTHWDFDNEAKNRSAYRKVQADELSAFVASLSAKYGCPVFTTGDYNCIQSSESMTYFRSINNMWCSKFDSKTYYNVYGSCTSLGVQVSPSGNSIDFVFGTKDTECLGNMIIVNCDTKDISDHRPVLADIRIIK